MSKQEQLTVRTSKMMQRAIEEAIEGEIKNKQTFVEESVMCNIDSLLEDTKGQKSLRDFMMDLSDTVDWIYIKSPTLDLEDKLKSEVDLEVYQNLELENDVHEKIKAASRYTGLSKSSVIRVCIIKHLYNNRDSLMGGNKRKVEDVWITTVRKINVGNMKLVNEIYYNLESEYMNKMMERPEQLLNLMNVSDAYKKFKETKGYKYMKTMDNGKEVLNVLESVKDHVESQENHNVVKNKNT